jgi:hypothetical protein
MVYIRNLKNVEILTMRKRTTKIVRMWVDLSEIQMDRLAPGILLGKPIYLQIEKR